MFSKGSIRGVKSEHVVWPATTTRGPVPSEVPEHVATDYNESVAVLGISPKASAALSRRCLQVILKEAGKAKARDLAEQIMEVLPTLPSHVAEDLDAVRNIGNFAAHQQKSTSTGVILDVEPHEAEWNLEVLEALFDFYYVQPELAKKRRASLSEKVQAAGKPPLKS